MPASSGRTDFVSDSNGCAREHPQEAILQGFSELVERDFLLRICGFTSLQRAAAGVDLESFGDEYLASAPDYYGVGSA